MPDHNNLPDKDEDRTQVKPYPPARQDDAVEVPAGEARTFDPDKPSEPPTIPDDRRLGPGGDPAEGRR